MTIDFHDVPEDGLTTDQNHGLGLKLGLFFETIADTTAEDNRFHFLVYYTLQDTKYKN